jgi:hypothetical protein
MGGTSSSTLSSSPISTPPVSTYGRIPAYGRGAQTKQNVSPIKKQVAAENLPYTQNVDVASGVKTPATAPGSYVVGGQQVPWTTPGSGLDQPVATPTTVKKKSKVPVAPAPTLATSGIPKETGLEAQSGTGMLSSWDR